jgi:hypothetical protein
MSIYLFAHYIARFPLWPMRRGGGRQNRIPLPGIPYVTSRTRKVERLTISSFQISRGGKSIFPATENLVARNFMRLPKKYPGNIS